MLYIPAYLLSGLWQTLRGRSHYSDNHFERQASAHAAQRTLRPDHSVARPAANNPAPDIDLEL